MNIPCVDAQNNTSIHISNEYYGNPQISRSPYIAQDNFAINQPVSINFVYQAPNDIHIYNIKCREISIQLLNELSSNASNISFNQNEFIFFYQRQDNNQFYQIVCEIISSSFIINLLNRTIHGNEIEHHIGYEELTFKFDQKENLKYHLTQYLNRFFSEIILSSR
ncbi:hypothetical protein RclHR1_12170003 [Rhizophagus clarus]|nr:hypothetical protein RclHR1_12170003 [Rhizophagus clarus]